MGQQSFLVDSMTQERYYEYMLRKTREEKMIYSLVEAQVREAIDKAENINADGSINWSFVDSDCYMSGVTKFFKDDEAYYETWNDIVDVIVAEMKEEAFSEHQLELKL